ncbi:MAG: hypothetical protein GY926_05605 [bacterium]|uniref:hypothetical protein n=1 Tax=Herbaspirillum sp. TaxID=1890675 RepID=UPI00258F2549|nr:hypothetical protein [Herbaspirillum sp.]MCP3949456.1 hypothetical protein [Herbaspirillum sp.]MCP4222207.1 hypothetical protein [Actinomycetes bacterium]MCP4964691.1 hypothetical protein [bacterium]
MTTIQIEHRGLDRRLNYVSFSQRGFKHRPSMAELLQGWIFRRAELGWPVGEA